ncbi:hypothetical protein [Nonomuraea sp. NPDC050783]|uniref:hypothetical protein n=1 Tax=Nonomuraea sp. NPDC050783 TaxID=3154634 RepID=UPI003467862E
MTEDLENRLRDTLGHASERAPQAPPGLPGRIVARAGRRRARRHGTLAGLAAGLVAGLVAAAIAVPMTVTGDGPGKGGVTTSVIESEPTPPADAAWSRPPLGEALVLRNPSEDRDMSLWFARRKEDGGAVLCWTYLSRTGGSTSSCNQEPVGGTASLEGSTQSWPPPERVLYFGAAGDAVAGVAAVSDGGDRVRGSIHHPRGAPRAVWTVTVPAGTRVGSFEFTGAGGDVLARVDNTPMIVPEATAEPAGEVLKLDGGLSANVYDVPDRTLIWRLAGRPVASDLVRAKDLMKDLGGDTMPVLLHERDHRWFGLASDVRTAEVELVLADGRKARTRARKDPWGIGVRVFAGSHEREGDIYREGFQIVGYDAAGREIWREPHPAQPADGEVFRPR